MFKPLALCLTLFLTLVDGVSPAKAQPYLLQPGDSLDIRVFGLPTLDRVVPIDETGAVVVPLSGRVEVAGKSLEEVTAILSESLSRRVVRQRNSVGNETMFSIRPDEVSVAVSSYRPIYVDGDVGLPGTVDFMPGMTVRRAVAAAGGTGPRQDRDLTPQLMQIMTRERAVRAELAALEARIARLQSPVTEEVVGAELSAELGTEGALASNGADVSTTEAGLRAAEVEGLWVERDYLIEAQAAVKREVALLQQQLEAWIETEVADQEEFDRLQDLLDNGLVPTDRLVVARRAVLTSRTQRLETESEVADRVRDLNRIEFELEDLFGAAEQARLEDLSTHSARRDTLAAQLVGLREEMLFFGAGTSALGDSAQVVIRVVRGDETILLRGDDDMLLHPGDLVTLQLVLDDVEN